MPFSGKLVTRFGSYRIVLVALLFLCFEFGRTQFVPHHGGNWFWIAVV
jgi:hypothetical protein